MPKQHKPNQLITFSATDKEFHESWDEDRSPGNFPHPWRAVLCGPPNSGKSTLIKNLILQADPPFERCYLLYPGGGDLKERTSEWDDVNGIELLDTIPPPSFFPKSTDSKSKKTLVITDDIDLKALTRDERSNLDRLFGTVSTHRNVSIVSTAQDFFSTPPVVRRMCSYWIIWKHRDKHSIGNIARKTGEDLDQLFKTVAKGPYDSICVDLSKGTPYPLRLNIFNKIYVC
jgi:hypothetical protein